jgi:hypothetical protein
MSPSALPARQVATYSCNLTNLWSRDSHPVLYDTVASSAHWTPPVLACHSKRYEMWALGAFASLGVELVAEVRNQSFIFSLMTSVVILKT